MAAPSLVVVLCLAKRAANAFAEKLLTLRAQGRAIAIAYCGGWREALGTCVDDRGTTFAQAWTDAHGTVGSLHSPSWAEAQADGRAFRVTLHLRTYLASVLVECLESDGSVLVTCWGAPVDVIFQDRNHVLVRGTRPDATGDLAILHRATRAVWSRCSFHYLVRDVQQRKRM